MLKHPFRVLWRFADFLIVSFLAISDFLLRKWLFGKTNHAERAAWSHRWARQFVRCLNIQPSFSGEPPMSGILTANHLGYLDILLLAARQPVVFVSKSEVRNWPIIGWLAICGGTLFVNRQRKSDVAALGPAFAPVINAGAVLVLFPEGTSTGGDRVLPFMPSLLEPAAQNGWAISPAWIGYSLNEGSVADEVAYWRDMTFLPHFVNLLSKSEIRARVVYSPSMPSGLDRKRLAKRLRDQIEETARQNGILIQGTDKNACATVT